MGGLISVSHSVGIEQRAPESQLGTRKWELDTPALLVDIPTYDQNVARLAAYCRQHGVSWRPHTKGQKVPALAQREIAAGAIGITCAKLGEAEVMAEAGVKDILIANQVVGTIKAARLAQLCKRADVMVAIDSIENAQALSAAMTQAGGTLRVLIEVDIGMNRAGVTPGAAVLELATAVRALPGLRCAGVMGWEGHCGDIEDRTEKASACKQAVGLLLQSVRLCRDHDLPMPIVSCGGTLTYEFTAQIPGVTEVQAGGGVFGDLLYASHGVQHPFALTVLTTVTSRPTSTRIITDAGRKTMSADAAMPQPIGLTGIERVRLSAEHGRIDLSAPNTDLRIGDKLEWVVGYGDTTVCLHDQMFGIDRGVVTAVWPVAARGKLT
jgi:D-serine deaminase-like pyridoxal phosphate-dependent protein